MEIKKKNIYISAILAFIFPGLGHIYVGNLKKGLLFMLILVSLFLIGLAMKGGIIVLDEDLFFISRLLQICHFFNGSMFFITLLFSKFFGLGIEFGDITYSYYEIGQLFIIISALLNILIIFNAYDLAKNMFCEKEIKE
ncbi:MAG: DUF6677 family protein [bacterium]